ncbi:MAG: glycosyltransferase family 39 protein [Chloroflexi bacterium]|nr:glycosyltransferase family 39 protein [Chloroflexota bacterium]
MLGRGDLGAGGRRSTGPLLVLVVALLVGAALRFYDINWDHGQHLHPDERAITLRTLELRWPESFDVGLLFDAEKSPLNPKFFAYGSLTFYLLKLGAYLGSFFDPRLTGYEHLNLVGRFLSAGFDLGVIVLVYVLGSRLYSRWAGALAALLTAFAAFHIQLAHFWAADTPETFFILLALLFAYRVMTSGGSWNAALLGLAAGIALSFKISAAPIFAAVVAAQLLRVTRPFPTLPPDSGIAGRRENEMSESEAAEGWGWRAPGANELSTALGELMVTFAVAGVTFVVCQPYSVIDFPLFSRHLAEQSAMARGVADLPYTRQYAGTLPYLYYLWNLVVWGYGVPLGLTALASWAWIIWRSARSPRRTDLLLLAWVVSYFLITGSFHVKFMRYLMPIMPILTLWASVGLLALRARLSPESGTAGQRDSRIWEGVSPETSEMPAGSESSEQVSAGGTAAGAHPSVPPSRYLAVPLSRRWADALTAFVVVSTALWALAFMAIYVRPHSRVVASEWIYRNIPPGSVLALEHWDDALPLGFVFEGRLRRFEEYRKVDMNLYDDDDQRKVDLILNNLRAADYVILTSNRLYDSIPRLPERYPITTRYYEQLFAGQLGYKLVAQFTSYPGLFGITIVDDRADESFTVYDHPKVLIYQKVEALPTAELAAKIAPPGVTAAQGPRAAAPPKFKSLVLEPTAKEIQRAGGTFTELFPRSGLPTSVPWLLWLAAIVVLGVLLLPVASIAGARLPDLGYGLARPLGVLALGWLHWLLVSLGLMTSSRATVWLTLALLVVVAAVLGRRGLAALRHLWQTRREAVIGGEVAFWTAFAAVLLLRLMNPDLWHNAHGGEKPMDLAYLMAATKSSVYPPYDPWFAGGYLNYYYFGQVMLGVVLKLTGIEPSLGYNLAVPTLAAFAAGAAYTCAYALLARQRATRARAATIALFAPLFLLGIGNLGGAFKLWSSLMELGGSQLNSDIPGLSIVVNGVAGIWALLVGGKELPIPLDWYWSPTRVIKDTINEFPFFTFLYGDLHAHMIGLPFTLVALALSIAVALRPLRLVPTTPGTAGRRESGIAGDGEGSQGLEVVPIAGGSTDLVEALSATPQPPASDPAPPVSRSPAISGGERGWEAGLRTVTLAVALGSLWPTNSWDFPTYAGLFVVAAFLPWYLARSWSWRGFGRTALWAGLVLVLSYVCFWPFHANFQSFYSSVELTKDKSEIAAYLVIHGLFLFVLLSFVGFEYQRRAQSGNRAWLLRLVLAFVRRWERLPHLLRLIDALVRRRDERAAFVPYLLVAAAVPIALALAVGWNLIALLLGFLTLTLGLMLRRSYSRPVMITLGLFAAGLGLGIVCDLVNLQGDIGRMNTVFKFYFQIWSLWSVAAAVAVGLLIGRRTEDGGRTGSRTSVRPWKIAFGVLLFMSFVYVPISARAKALERFDTSVGATLDGMAYMLKTTHIEENRPLQLWHEYEALRWLQDFVPGSPVIAEAAVPIYRWGSRVSIYTGLPTIIGWDWHQKQQRWGYQEQVDRRLNDVRALYSDPSPERALQILRQYEVRYVYVGDLERAYYPAAGLEKFDRMIGSTLELVHANQRVKIYRVR